MRRSSKSDGCDGSNTFHWPLGFTSCFLVTNSQIERKGWIEMAISKFSILANIHPFNFEVSQFRPNSYHGHSSFYVPLLTVKGGPTNPSICKTHDMSELPVALRSQGNTASRCWHIHAGARMEGCSSWERQPHLMIKIPGLWATIFAQIKHADFSKPWTWHMYNPPDHHTWHPCFI